MYRILCLTNGSHIKIKASFCKVTSLTLGMPPNIRESIGNNITNLSYLWFIKPDAWEYLEFDTEDAAKWFISHKLVYNPRRKNHNKLLFMKNLFEFNDIPGWETIKIEFEVEKI